MIAVSKLVGAKKYKTAERFASLGFILGIGFRLIITIIVFSLEKNNFTSYVFHL